MKKFYQVSGRMAVKSSQVKLFSFRSSSSGYSTMRSSDDLEQLERLEKASSYLKRRGHLQGKEIPEAELLTKHYGPKSMTDIVVATTAAYVASRTSNDILGMKVIEWGKGIGALVRQSASVEFKPLPFSPQRERSICDGLKVAAAAADCSGQLASQGKPYLSVLITGAGGFIAMDLLHRFVADPNVKVVHCLLHKKRNSTVTDDQAKVTLMTNAGISLPEHLAKIEVLQGDVTADNLGLAPEVIESFQHELTHVYHLAASISFKDSVATMIEANTKACQKVLNFAYFLQNLPGSSFVQLVLTETAYIHGRTMSKCSEDALVFPEMGYNNAYELSKALADIYARYFMLEKGLRLCILCPAIVAGKYANGNSYGDMKSLNGMLNTLGAVHRDIQKQPRPVRAILQAILAFPGVKHAVIDIVDVDRVSDGFHSVLYHPEAVGERIHLGGEGISLGRITEIFFEETGLRFPLCIPPLYDAFWKYLMRVVCYAVNCKAAIRLEIAAFVFAGYGDWGQPEHKLGKDVTVLGLPLPRPDSEALLRVQCRHNQRVQQFGQVRDLGELQRSEQSWARLLDEMQKQCGHHVGTMSATAFRSALEQLVAQKGQ